MYDGHSSITFSRFLPIVDSTAVGGTRGGYAPVSVDMAWSELERALANSLLQNSREPLEQLRRIDLIPFGRALYALSECTQVPRNIGDWSARLSEASARQSS